MNPEERAMLNTFVEDGGRIHGWHTRRGAAVLDRLEKAGLIEAVQDRSGCGDHYAVKLTDTGWEMIRPRSDVEKLIDRAVSAALTAGAARAHGTWAFYPDGQHPEDLLKTALAELKKAVRP